MPRSAFRIGPIRRSGSGRVGVIDVGSNSIRLVVYDRLSRAPIPVFNEKVLCGLGRDLARTGRLNPEGVRLALTNLVRFTRLLEGMHVDRVDVLATAAVRDAEDGAAFAAEVERRCRLDLAVISGTEEARLSAMGVLSGAPGADGIMGDLGGASVELVGLNRAEIAEQVTLPLGPFRLMDVKEGKSRLRELIADRLRAEGWLEAYRGRTFYAVGGNWRALAKIHMEMRKHPVHIIHQYSVPAADILDLAALLGRQGKSSLDRVPGISKRRMETLPYAAMVMEGLIELLKPKAVSFSAFGLREGHLFDLLTPEARAQDPLEAACLDVAARFDRFGKVGRLEEWIAPLFVDETQAHRRLRKAACLLSDISWMDHPDYRAEHAFARVLRLPFVGLDHPGRAFLAAALYARYGGSPGDKLTAGPCELLTSDQRERATLIGATLRLGHTLSGGAVEVLDHARLQLTPDAVILWLPDDEQCLGGEVVRRRLDAVARTLGRAGRIVTAPAQDLMIGSGGNAA